MIAFAGDWHMNARWVPTAVRHAAEQGADVIVHLGDFGYTFRAEFLQSLQRALDEAGLVLLFIDGNHENFAALLSLPVGANGLRRLTDRIWHLPRGFRWTWGGVRFLALGGAHSVDQPWRRLGTSWWPEEVLSEQDVAAAVAGGPADVLVSHDCPAGVAIPGWAPTPTCGRPSSWCWPASTVSASARWSRRCARRGSGTATTTCATRYRRSRLRSGRGRRPRPRRHHRRGERGGGPPQGSARWVGCRDGAA